MAVIGVATNGTEALRQARELSPDVALVDISLGTENGFDVAREIKPYVGSVILISSTDHYEDDDYAELIAASLAVGFLSKATLSADAISRSSLVPSGTAGTGWSGDGRRRSARGGRGRPS